MKTIKNYLETCLNTYDESLLDDDDIFYGANSDKKVIECWIRDNYRIRDKLTITDDLVVDCSGRVKVKNKSITSLTNGLFRWGNVEGNFACGYTQITSLEGTPKKVGKNFDCSGCNNLKTLEGAPEKVDGDFWCNACGGLETLEGAPEKVGGEFECSGCNNLKTLEGAPKKVGGYFCCSYCKNITSLKGAPEKVGGHFSCSHCDKLETLKGAPEKVGGGFYCKRCKNLKISDSDRRKYKIRDLM